MNTLKILFAALPWARSAGLRMAEESLGAVRAAAPAELLKEEIGRSAICGGGSSRHEESFGAVALHAPASEDAQLPPGLSAADVRSLKAFVAKREK